MALTVPRPSASLRAPVMIPQKTPEEVPPYLPFQMQRLLMLREVTLFGPRLCGQLMAGPECEPCSPLFKELSC